MDTTPLEEQMHPGEQENLQEFESKEPSPTVEGELHSGEQGNVHISESKDPPFIVEEEIRSGEHGDVQMSESKEPSPIVEEQRHSGEQGNVQISKTKEPSLIVIEEMHSGEEGNVQISESKEPSSPIVAEQKHSSEEGNVQISELKEPSSPIVAEQKHSSEEGNVQISELKEPSLPVVAEQKHSGEQGNVQKSELDKPSQILEERSPTVGMVFNSEEDLHTYFQRYAYQVGFGFKRISTKSGSNGRVKYFSLACSRGGKFVSAARSSATLRPSIKTGCLAKINVVVEASGRCTLSCVYPDHNHPLSPKQARYQKGPKRRLEERDCKNDTIARVRQLRLCAGDAEALSNYFARMKRRNSNFDHVVDLDDEGRVRNIFWADARSRAAYESFMDVVSFDSTNLTNKYNMPLVMLVGVNHHGQSVLFGCGLLSNQDTETYTWLFRSWLECMNGRHPKAVITDQHDAIQAAVAQVFPHSHHRLCLWHIMKKIPEKTRGLSECNFKEIFESIVYDSIEPNEFDEKWSRMIQDYKLEGNDWLSSLFQDRAHWVPAYVKRTFWAGLGMPSTQSETTKKSFFDDYVNSKTTLKEFVEQYDDALMSKMEKECKADFESLDPSYALITDYYFERQFQDAYTNTIFKLFQDELRGLLYCNSMLDRVDGAVSVFNVSDVLREKDGNSNKRVAYTVTFNETECDIECSCHLFEHKGVVCRHMVKVLIENDVSEVPPRYILTRWRKDVKRRHDYVKNCYGDCQNSERGVRFDKLCANFFEAADIASNSLDAYEALMRCIDEAKFNLKNEESSRPLTQGIELRYHGTNSSKGRLQSNKKSATAEQTTKRRKKKKDMQNPEASSVNESIGQINFGQQLQRYDEQGINLSFDSGAVSMSISGINHNHYGSLKD